MNATSSKRSKTHRGSEEGSALVEFALSLPLLCLFILGSAECTQLAYAAIEVANSAHAAAVYAASSAAATTDSGGISNAATADSANLTGGNAVSVTSVGTDCTCSNTAYTPSSCSDNQTCFNNNAAMITTVTITTQASFTPLIHVPGMRGSTGCPGCFNLQGKSSQVVSNQ